MLISGERWLAVCHPLAAPRLLTPRVSRIALGIVVAAALLSNVPTVFEYRTKNSRDEWIHNVSLNVTYTTKAVINARPSNTELVQQTQQSRSMAVDTHQSALSSSDEQIMHNPPPNECDSSVGKTGFDRTDIGNHPLYTIGYRQREVLLLITTNEEFKRIN